MSAFDERPQQRSLDFGDSDRSDPCHYSRFPERLPLQDGEVFLLRNAIETEHAARLVQHFKTAIKWQHEVYRGRPTLRGTAWFADRNVEYRYSGQTMIGGGWDSMVDNLRDRVQSLCGVPFNSVLMNHYPDGTAQMGWHSDDEPELGQNPTIASLSFGAARVFKLRHNVTGEVVHCTLDDNCLLVMAGALQHHWQHTIPRRTSTIGERFNLTFRNTKPNFWNTQ